MFFSFFSFRFAFRHREGKTLILIYISWRSYRPKLKTGNWHTQIPLTCNRAEREPNKNIAFCMWCLSSKWLFSFLLIFLFSLSRSLYLNILFSLLLLNATLSMWSKNFTFIPRHVRKQKKNMCLCGFFLFQSSYRPSVWIRRKSHYQW